MSEADVADTVDAFARAAADAERLGFDGVELLAAHGYLINQFFLDHLNLRQPPPHCGRLSGFLSRSRVSDQRTIAKKQGVPDSDRTSTFCGHRRCF
jgi:hypothetical protein